MELHSMSINEGVPLLLALIQNEQGLRTPALATRMNTSSKNIERGLKQLKDQRKIEFQVAPKTGGYHAIGKPDV